MAFVHGSNTYAFFQHWNCTKGLRSLTLAGQKELADTTHMGDNDRTFIEGMRTATLNMSGIFDTDDDNFRDNVERSFNIGDRQFAVAFGGVNNGQNAYMTRALCTSFGETSPISDVNMVDADFQLVEQIRPAYFMHNGPLANSETTAWIDLGDDDWDNKLIRIHMWNKASNTVAITIQESDNITPQTPVVNNKTTLNIGVSTNVAEWSNTSASLDLGRYVRLRLIGSSTPSIAAFVHVSNNP